MSRNALRRTAVVAAGVVLCGCESFSGVPTSELPKSPIAFTYRTPEEARRRAEDFADAHDDGAPDLPRQARPGTNDIYGTADDVSEYLGRLFGRAEDVGSTHLGRLALLDPRSGEVAVIEAARRGSIPLAWSRDHARLLFAQPGAQDFQIYEYERESRTVRPVTYGPPAHTQGCYAAADRIVVAAVDTRVQPAASHLAISGEGGRRPFRSLTDGPGDHSPACAPDGSAVVFVRESGPGATELFHLALGDPAAAPRRLSPGRHPTWSHDGAWIAFAAPYRRELRIWRMRPDGSGRAPIGRGIRHEARPAISPDGRVVAYVAAEEVPRRHLYLRRFDGSGDRILFADGDGEYPVW